MDKTSIIDVWISELTEVEHVDVLLAPCQLFEAFHETARPAQGDVNARRGEDFSVDPVVDWKSQASCNSLCVAIATVLCTGFVLFESIDLLRFRAKLLQIVSNCIIIIGAFKLYNCKIKSEPVQRTKDLHRRVFVCCAVWVRVRVFPLNVLKAELKHKLPTS